jgi:hypothetical protein
MTVLAWHRRESEFRREEEAAVRRGDHDAADRAHRQRVRCLDEAGRILAGAVPARQARPRRLQ